MKSEDFVIHLGTNMTSEDRDELKGIMTGVEGVISVHFCDERKLELVVTYNPDKVNPAGISEVVRRWNA